MLQNLRKKTLAVFGFGNKIKSSLWLHLSYFFLSLFSQFSDKKSLYSREIWCRKLLFRRSFSSDRDTHQTPWYFSISDIIRESLDFLGFLSRIQNGKVGAFPMFVDFSGEISHRERPERNVAGESNRDIEPIFHLVQQPASFSLLAQATLSFPGKITLKRFHILQFDFLLSKPRGSKHF